MIDLAAVGERASAIEDSLRGYRHGRARVVDYRLNYGEGRTASLGIHDSQVGSVYSPFQIADGVRGAFFVAWSDGKISRGVIDGNQGSDLDGVLDDAWTTRFRDDEARQFVGPARVRPTPVFHPAVDRLLSGNFAPLYEIVDLIRDRGRRLDVKKVSGSAHASVGASVIRTSQGLDYLAASSEFSFSFGYDSELWDGRSRRRPFTLGEVGRVVDRAARLLPSLRREVEGGPGGKVRAVFLPGFVGELLGAFVLSNLHGAEVATGQSAWKPQDFRARKRVFRPDLRLRVDPTVAYSSGSFRITTEGIAAAPTTYVERGRLLRSIVGLKYARRLKVRPTTPPTTMESVFLEMGRPLAESAALRAVGEGFVVLSALGLHTQDAASGDFSLTAPRALVVRRGKLAGVTKAVIAGNFFQVLNDPRTRLVRIGGTRLPGMLLDCHVSVG